MRLRSLALLLATAFPLHAHMGNTLEQALFSYGQPVASRVAKPGQLTSTRTFSINGLVIVCGFLDGKVAMETYTNPNRDFLPSEVEALLRTESESKGWTPPGPYTGTMNYKRTDGAAANLTGNKLEIYTPAWLAALAKDHAAAKSPATGQTNTAPASPATQTSAAPLSPDATLNPPAKHAGTVVTNSAP